MSVEKLRLRPWLENVLNAGETPGVKWLDYREKVFQVSWKHASRQGWSLDIDAGIFKLWAMHTGKYHQTRDKPEPRRWKANFRCALNALPDIKELHDRGVTRGNNAYKVYQMLSKNTDHPKDKAKDMKEADSKINHTTKILSKFKQRVIPRSPVIKRHSVIHKSSTVFHDSNSRHAICTTHPVNPQTLFPYWTRVTPYSSHPHMKDHDYLTTWYDPRPEMKDIGVMTYHEIKKEPVSPENQLSHCCPGYDQDTIVALTDSHYINNVKEEKTIPCDEEIDFPSDQEIIDLVDRMSQDSDASSDASGSSYEDYDDRDNYLDGSLRLKESHTGTVAVTKPHKMNSEEYWLRMYGYQSTAPPALTPESTSEILEDINVSQ